MKAWRQRTLSDLDNNAHFSQLNAISILVDVFPQQQTLLREMDPAADMVVFQSKAFDLVQNVIRSQKLWDFFRAKLDLRFSPTFSAPGYKAITSNSVWRRRRWNNQVSLGEQTPGRLPVTTFS